MDALQIGFADRATCSDRLELLAELSSDPMLQRVSRDRYRTESELLAARIKRLDNAAYCDDCGNVEVEADGDRCEECDHQRRVELADEHATEAL